MNEKKTEKDPNLILIGMNTRVRNIVRYCNGLFREKETRSLHFSAIGRTIGKLVSAVEILKVVNADLYQQNRLATVIYQSVDNQKNVSNQKIFHKMEVTLSLDKFDKINEEGFQDKIEEQQRLQFYDIFNSGINNRRNFNRRNNNFMPRRGFNNFRNRNFGRGNFGRRGRGFRRVLRGFRSRRGRRA